MSKKHCRKEYKSIIKILEKHGWYMAYQRGDHKYYKHPEIGGKITVPYYMTKNIELSILRQAGLRKGCNFKNG